jgi:hypothetical protein
MVQVLNESSMLLLYDNVPCISFSNKRGVLMTCIVFTCGQGVPLTTHPHIAPMLKKELSYNSTHTLGLRGLF